MLSNTHVIVNNTTINAAVWPLSDSQGSLGDVSFYNCLICMHTVPGRTALAPPNWFKISENDPGPPHPASNAPPRPAPAPATGLRSNHFLRAEPYNKQQTNYQQLFQILSTPLTPARNRSKESQCYKYFCRSTNIFSIQPASVESKRLSW